MYYKYRIEEMTRANGEVLYIIWLTKWWGLKKVRSVSDYYTLESAQSSLDYYNRHLIIKRKWIKL